MTEKELYKREIIFEDGREVTVSYSITYGSDDRFGICVRALPRGDVAAVPCITNSEDEAKALLFAMKEGCVTPVSVMDIVQDFLHTSKF